MKKRKVTAQLQQEKMVLIEQKFCQARKMLPRYTELPQSDMRNFCEAIELYKKGLCHEACSRIYGLFRIAFKDKYINHRERVKKILRDIRYPKTQLQQQFPFE